MNYGVKNDDTPDKVFVMVNGMMVNVSDMPENDTVENQDIWHDDVRFVVNISFDIYWLIKVIVPVPLIY